MPPENLPVIFFLIFAQIIFLSLGDPCREIYPEQVHLSLGEYPEEITVTWVTFLPTEDSVVWYGIAAEGLTTRSEGFSEKFVDGGGTGTARYIHRVMLKELEPNCFYGI